MSQATSPRRLAQDPDRLYRQRVKARMSQRQAAKSAGISDTTICRAEKGTTSVQPETLHRLAAAYGCEVEDLMPAEPSAAGPR